MDQRTTEIVTKAIEASTRPELWPEICDQMVSYTGATAFILFEFDFENFGGVRAAASSKFAKHGQDVIEQTLAGPPDVELDAYARFGEQPAMAMVSEHQLYGLNNDDGMPENPFRDRVLEVAGSKSRHVARINDIGPWADVAAIHASCAGEDVPPELHHVTNGLLPIFAKSLEAGRVIRGITKTYNSLLAAFDALDFGAALVDATGHIVVSNRSFGELASDRDALTDVGGIASSTHPGDSATLRGLITSAFAASAKPADLVGALQRRSGRLPLVVKAAPIREDDVSRATLVLLLVIDPEDERRLNADGLAAFGLLTDAELEVCTYLMRGAPTEEIADLRDTSLETTRGQIKSARAKLACDTRLDLVRLAMSTRPPLQTKK